MASTAKEKADICAIAAFAAQKAGVLDPRLFER
jgi:hypothetical protein